MTKTAPPLADTRDMYRIHTMLRREFGMLASLVHGVAKGEVARARIVADHIKLLNVVLHQHHSGEDAVLWPRLRIRAPEEIAPVVALLEEQHQEIDALTLRVDTLLSSWIADAALADREALVDAIGRLTVALDNHTHLEEKLILPVVERHIFASEWQLMVEEGAEKIPPEIIPVMIGMMMYGGGSEEHPEVSKSVAAQAPMAYATYCERIHGRSAPPAR
ncbi:MAG: hemerythrin domain-containing protein [Mycobacterium sp.]